MIRFLSPSRLARLVLLTGYAGLALTTSESSAVVTFVDATVSAGIVHDAAPLSINELAGLATEEILTGGAAAGDFDGDGWVDLFVTRHFDTDVLYRNLGNGTFSDVTANAFVDGPANLQTTGAAWGDIDNDGDLDLYTTAIFESQHYLYINDGSGQFSEQAVARGAAVGDGTRDVSGTSVSMGDYDNDGYLDLYVTEWRNGDDSIPAQARLLHNLGTVSPGNFEDVTAAAGVNMDLTVGPRAGKTSSFTPRFVDFDRDGYQDIAVVSDFGTSRLFWNNGDGTFADGTAAAAINTGTNDMGFTVGDVDGDGLPDWFSSSIFREPGHPDGNRLFKNHGDRTFTDVTDQAGVRDGGWGWGSDMLDFDNDGDLDIAMTNGFISLDTPTHQVRLFENDGSGVFSEISDSVGITNVSQGRGLLTFDFDRDGDQDVFIVNNHDEPVLYRNDGGNENAWLRVQAVGQRSNANGIGAVVEVVPNLSDPGTTMVQDIDGSSNYLAQSEPIAHFGLGSLSSTVDQVIVTWPASGLVQTFNDVPINSMLVVLEPAFGDFDLDGDVDGNDLAYWQVDFGIDAGADADGDGDTDGADYLIWQRNFSGLGAISMIADVPEPASAMLLLGAILLSTSGRRRK